MINATAGIHMSTTVFCSNTGLRPQIEKASMLNQKLVPLGIVGVSTELESINSRCKTLVRIE